MESFWTADRVWVSTTDSLTEPLDADFLEYMPPEGSMPMEFIEGHPLLASITLSLTEKLPR
jgi:hypothetical protein